MTLQQQPPPIRLAILDMYDNTPNEGMRCIKELVGQHSNIAYDIYDVRNRCEVPNLSYDIYISTGGPGNPLEGDGVWDVKYYNWLEALWEYNHNTNEKKYALFICHSFQMACQYFRLGEVVPRKSPAFGTFPVHKTFDGKKDPIFKHLPNPFYAADFRKFQLIEPNYEVFEAIGAKILALEKIRPHIPLERAIMAVRFSEEWLGVQFHPEADSEGMLKYFREDERSANIVAHHGQEKLDEMVHHLEELDRIPLTHNTIVPHFLTIAVARLAERSFLYA